MDLSKRFDKANGGCPSIQCEANREVLCNSCAEGAITAAHRVSMRSVEPCLFGKGGTCCRNCNMGPCQIIDGVEDMENGASPMPGIEIIIYCPGR